jgi:hypothetical protein
LAGILARRETDAAHRGRRFEMLKIAVKLRPWYRTSASTDITFLRSFRHSAAPSRDGRPGPNRHFGVGKHMHHRVEIPWRCILGCHSLVSHQHLNNMTNSLVDTAQAKITMTNEFVV